MFKLKTFFLPLISLLLFATPVLAGGGPIYISAGSTLSSWDNPSSPRQIVAKVHLHPDVLCVGTKITFKYEDQKDGDAVSTGSGESSYVIQEVGARWLNGKSVYDCGTYAKYTSKNKELKIAIISVAIPKGETYERKIALNFQSNDPIISSDETLPWDGDGRDLSAPQIYLKYDLGELAYNNKQTISLQWNLLPGISEYKVFITRSKDEPRGQGVDINTNSYTVGVDRSLENYISVGICKSPGACFYSNVIALPKTLPVISEANEQTTVSSTAPASSGAKTEELNQKIENLQKQLQESQKRQASLEQTVNNLLKWIRSVLPFFK